MLIDNCVPRRLAKAIVGHTVETVGDLGWAALSDGELLDRADGHYEVFVTVDRGICHQQRLRSRQFGILVMRARTNRLADLMPLLPALLEQIERIGAGQVAEVGGPRS